MGVAHLERKKLSLARSSDPSSRLARIALARMIGKHEGTSALMDSDPGETSVPIALLASLYGPTLAGMVGQAIDPTAFGALHTFFLSTRSTRDQESRGLVRPLQVEIEMSSM